MLGLLWGAAMASVQLAASWELARFVGSTERSFSELAFFGFPPAHWAELAIPGFARGIPGGPEATYWYALGTSGYEACFYVGTLPLILAFVGMFGRHNRPLAPWLLISAAALILAMLPTLWPAGYRVVLSMPGVGWFRAPGRYVLLSSLGLCLFAGRGLDRAREEPPIMWGLGFSLAFAAAAGAWLVLLGVERRSSAGLEWSAAGALPDCRGDLLGCRDTPGHGLARSTGSALGRSCWRRPRSWVGSTTRRPPCGVGRLIFLNRAPFWPGWRRNRG